MTLAVAVRVLKSLPNNEVVGRIVVVVSLDLVEVDVVLVRRLGESQLGTVADVTENTATDGPDGAKDALAHQLECPGDGVGLLFGDIGRSRHIQCFPETFKWDGSQCHLTVIS